MSKSSNATPPTLSGIALVYLPGVSDAEAGVGAGGRILLQNPLGLAAAWIPPLLQPPLACASKQAPGLKKAHGLPT